MKMLMFRCFLVTKREVKTDYDVRDSRRSQQLQAMENPSEEEVALPSSSMTTKLLHLLDVSFMHAPFTLIINQL